MAELQPGIDRGIKYPGAFSRRHATGVELARREEVVGVVHGCWGERGGGLSLVDVLCGG